jgi:hypothetical protein
MICWSFFPAPSFHKTPKEFCSPTLGIANLSPKWMLFAPVGRKLRFASLEVDLYKIAEDLTGRPIDQLIPCRSGKNSRVYQVICGGDTFALKIYPSNTADPRDRFGTEIKALKFYEVNRNPHTSRLLAVDIAHGIALMEWIGGCLVNAPTTSDIDQAIDFIACTHAASTQEGNAFGLAAEPCLCGADLDRHLILRLEKLSSVAKQEPELKHFLTHELLPVLEKARNQAIGPSFAKCLPQKKQSLIPADFGFHNAIKSHSGKLYFIDFEYFGWDDPVRLTADTLLHPGMTLDENCRLRFRQGMLDIFKTDEAFEQRLLQLLPLYGIRWILILLNEFLPERWQARVFAGETAGWQEIKQQQLKKARSAADKTMAYLKLL